MKTNKKWSLRLGDLFLIVMLALVISLMFPFVCEHLPSAIKGALFKGYENYNSSLSSSLICSLLFLAVGLKLNRDQAKKVDLLADQANKLIHQEAIQRKREEFFYNYNTFPNITLRILEYSNSDLAPTSHFVSVAPFKTNVDQGRFTENGKDYFVVRINPVASEEEQATLGETYAQYGIKEGELYYCKFESGTWILAYDTIEQGIPFQCSGAISDVFHVLSAEDRYHPESERTRGLEVVSGPRLTGDGYKLTIYKSNAHRGDRLYLTINDSSPKEIIKVLPKGCSDFTVTPTYDIQGLRGYFKDRDTREKIIKLVQDLIESQTDLNLNPTFWNLRTWF